MNYPSELTAQEIIPYFLELARRLLTPPISSGHVLQEFIRFYRECRVTGASVDDDSDADMLCIECGHYSKVTAVAIDDFRGQGDIGYVSAPDELQLSMSRTVYVVGEEQSESEFDDDAFEMAITLYFGSEKEDASSVLEVSTLEGLESELPEFLQDDLTARLLTRIPTETSAHVGGAG